MTKLRSTQANVVPDEERNAIIAEAKSQALAEIVKRAKTIAQLDEVLEYGTEDKVEISNQKSIKLTTLVEQFKKDILASVGSIFTYCGSVNKYSELPADVEVGDVYDVKEAHDGVPAGTNYVWNGTDWDALSGAINLDGYATLEQLEANYVQKVVGKELIATEKIETIDKLSQEILSCVKFIDLGNGRKCIQLSNNDLIVGESLDGSTYNLIMLSKFDIVDVGTVSKKLNFNVPKGERPTVQEAGQTGEEAHKIITNMSNVVPPIERAEIVAEAKQAAITEVVKRSRTINQLPVTSDPSGKKLELGSGEAITAEDLIAKAAENAGCFWEDE